RHAVRLFATDVDRRMGGLAEMPEACSLRRLVRAKARIDARLRDEIARDVLGEERVVGHVGVERADDVIAIAPRLGDGEVLLVAVRLREAHEVEPMAAPGLSERGRR